MVGEFRFSEPRVSYILLPVHENVVFEAIKAEKVIDGLIDTAILGVRLFNMERRSLVVEVFRDGERLYFAVNKQCRAEELTRSKIIEELINKIGFVRKRDVKFAFAQ